MVDCFVFARIWHLFSTFLSVCMKSNNHFEEVAKKLIDADGCNLLGTTNRLFISSRKKAPQSLFLSPSYCFILTVVSFSNSTKSRVKTISLNQISVFS